LSGLHTRGASFRTELAEIDAMGAQNLALAETVQDTKSNVLAKQLAAADAKEAALEGEVLRKLSQDGIEARDREGRPLSPEQRDVVTKLVTSEGGKPSPMAEAVA